MGVFRKSDKLKKLCLAFVLCLSIVSMGYAKGYPNIGKKTNSDRTVELNEKNDGEDIYQIKNSFGNVVFETKKIMDIPLWFNNYCIQFLGFHVEKKIIK